MSLDPTENFVLKGEMPYTTSQSIADYLNFVYSASQYSAFKSNYFGHLWLIHSQSAVIDTPRFHPIYNVHRLESPPSHQ